MRRFSFLIVLSLTGIARADFTVFHGDSAQESLWRIAAGGNVPLESFESYTGVGGPGTGGDTLAALGSVHVVFDPIVPGVYDDGQWAHSGTKQWSNWAGGAGNSASHILRPEAGRRIYALGFWNCDPQGDQPMEAYDAANQLIGTITGNLNDHNSDPAQSTGFAGFVSTIPVAYVRIPGAFGDGWNHFDDLQVATRLIVQADYNKNGIVDTADYIVYRDTLGQTGTSLAADGNANGQIDTGDYDVWRAHFGELVGSGSSARLKAAVPETAPRIMLMFGAALLCLLRRRAV
jgi:hypothetical protein